MPDISSVGSLVFLARLDQLAMVDRVDLSERFRFCPFCSSWSSLNGWMGGNKWNARMEWRELSSPWGSVYRYFVYMLKYSLFNVVVRANRLDS